MIKIKQYKCTYNKCLYFSNNKCKFTEKDLERIKNFERPFCLGGENVDFKDLVLVKED